MLRSKLEADVLIIGGGAAGLCAAIAARRAGASVLVLSRGSPGHSGVTFKSEGRIAAALGSGDSSRLHLEDTLRAGRGACIRELAEVLASEAPDAVRQLAELGVRFKRKGGRLLLDLSPGHSRHRICCVEGRPPGAELSRSLARAAAALEARLAGYTPVIKLLTDRNRAVGCLAYDTRRKKTLEVSAGSVVLAAGGGARVYARSDATPDACGEGYALALDAGAKLIDMEFVQFYPLITVKPISGFLILASPLYDGAHLLNRLGEKFMLKYSAREVEDRDIMSRAIYQEAKEGRGVDGGVLMDFSEIPEDILESKYARLLSLFRRYGVDLKREPIVVSPAAHFFCGGLEIDEQGGSSLEGLYAAGEAAGGVHGANRLPGNALAEAVVFGLRAGKAAAEYAMEEGRGSLPGGCELPRCEVDPKLAEARVREAAWQLVGVIRDKVGLEEAVSFAREARERWVSFSSEGDPHGMRLWSMLLTLEAVALSALERKGSLGVHYRRDMPASVGGHVRIWMKNGELKAEWSSA